MNLFLVGTVIFVIIYLFLNWFAKTSSKKIARGASLVQLYTGMVYKGPRIAYSISSELIDILKNKGFKNVSEAIGSKN